MRPPRYGLCNSALEVLLSLSASHGSINLRQRLKAPLALGRGYGFIAVPPSGPVLVAASVAGAGTRHEGPYHATFHGGLGPFHDSRSRVRYDCGADRYIHSYTGTNAHAGHADLRGR